MWMSEALRASRTGGPRGHGFVRAILGVLLLIASNAALAQEAWLITYGPGGDAWSRFGHDALMLRGDGEGARNYAFGYFDPARPGFVGDFIQGRMIYEGHKTDAEREMAAYQAMDRSVRRQRLNLSTTEFERLRRLLERNVAPENRTYEYDYYFHNCATRLRDILDQALKGALSDQFRDTPARLNFREHTHRLTQDDFWLHTGLMFVLGPGIDGERTAWQEMFLPTALADHLADARADGEPLVVEDHYWYESQAHGAPEQPRHQWGDYGLLGLASAGLLLVPMYFGRRWWRSVPLALYVASSAIAGTGLLYLWMASTHDAIHGNALLLLLNPLWLGLFRGGSRHYRVGLLVVLGLLTLVGAVVLAWPEGYQYRPAPLLWLIPANVAALVAGWWRWRATNAEQWSVS